MAESNTKLYGGGPLVTVYVPSRSYGRYLAQAVASVRAQLYPNWELFIVDDASTDSTASVAEHLQREEPDRIRVIRNETPQGVQRSANRILELARGRYLIRLDADDWFEESALLLMVAKLESDPDLGIVYGNFFYTDAEGHVIGVERRRQLGVEDTAGHLAPHGACTMVRTRVLKAVGGYSEDVNAQDGWDLWYKLVNRVKAASLQAPLFFYRQHEQSVSRDESRLLNARARIIAKARGRLDDSYVPSCLAVVPVRESYPGFEGVPYQQIGGRSLLECAIESAQSAIGVTATAVSSESAKVLDFARKLSETGAVQPHMQIDRPAQLAGSHIRLREILCHAAEGYRAARGSYPDIVMYLSVHAPLRRALHVDKAIDTLRITASDSVVSVCEENEPVFAPSRDGLRLLNPGRFDELVYERERLYRFNGAVLAAWWEILADGDLFGQRIGSIEMRNEDSVQVRRLLDLERLRVQTDAEPAAVRPASAS